MRAYLIQTYQSVLASYWFVPTIMAILAAILALVLIQIDNWLPRTFVGDNPFFYATQPDGARSILNAIGGSMIGVAGTVFSVTMATVVFASGTYGPRLLTNFMNDRGNQVTLGTFVATFVYSILVLRTVRDGGDEAFGAMFVPNLAIYGAILLAICSIGILIYFIHHVPSNIHISNVIAGIGHNLIVRIEREFPELSDEDEAREARDWQVPGCFRTEDLDRTPGDAAYSSIHAEKDGYIQIIDKETLVEAAAKSEVVVRAACRPGVFVHSGRVIFDAWPAERVSEETRAALLSSVAVGTSRSPRQDLNFLFDELVEIAGRALSPGVNDPYTAITAMDWLKSAMASLASRRTDDPYWCDGEDKLRVLTVTAGFDEYLEIAFGHLRQYASADTIAGEHFVNCLIEIVPACMRDDQRHAIRDQMEAFVGLASENLSGRSLQTVEQAASRLDRCLIDPEACIPRCRVDIRRA